MHASLSGSLTALAGRAGRPRAWRLAWQCLLFGLVYGLCARVGLAYSSVGPNVTLIWPPTGLSLFVVLRWGPALVPGILLGDLLANAGTGASPAAICGIAAGNIAQTLAALWGLRRAGFDAGLARIRDVVAILLFGSLAAGLSALLGPAALAAGGHLAPGSYGTALLQWWMGDATGVVVLAPVLLAWWRPQRAIPAGQRLEAAGLLLAVLLLCELVFVGPLTRSSAIGGNYPAALACFPVVIWAALRFGLRGATLVTLLVSAAAVLGTAQGMGPLAAEDQVASLPRWWVFANVITVTGLLLAASQAERDRARAEAIRDRDFVSTVLDAEGALLVVLDAGGRIVRVNRSFERLTGFAGAELAGQPFEQAVIPAQDHTKVRGHAELLRLRLSDAARLESPLRRRRGPPVTVSWTATALRDAQGGMTHAIVSGVDVSARVEAAAALRTARRTLEQRVAERTRELAAANAALQDEMRQRRAVEQALIDAGERAQEHFGRELHDSLGQHLTATAVQAELLAGDLRAAGEGAGEQAARQIEAMLSAAVAQTRLLAQGLFPVDIAASGLWGALEQLARSTERQTRRACVLQGAAVETPDHAVAMHLYRIAQEAVNNAIKHGSGAIVLELRAQREAATLAVRSSLRAGGAAAGDGLGLRTMGHRAHLIGARLAAGPRDGGWCVRVDWPVPEETR